MQKLLEILTTDIETKDHPSTSESWPLRQSAAQDEWRKARLYHLNSLLSCNEVPIKTCCNCSSQAVIRCRDCMPNEWLCIDCDETKHQSLALHNRESCVNGMFKPIEPGLCLVHEDGKYELVSQGSTFVIYLKVDTFCFAFCVIISLITTLIGAFSAMPLIIEHFF